MNNLPETQKQGSIIEGRINTTPKGLGFVRREDNTLEDVRIEQGFLNTALHGDIVRASLHAHQPNVQQTGEVIEVVTRARTKFVGTIKKENGAAYLVPDARKMYTSILLPDIDQSIPTETKAFVEMNPWTNPSTAPTGRVIEAIGPKGEHEVEIRAIILENGIDDTFPAPVAQEAEELHTKHSADVTAHAGERTDFRDILTLTIDPVDAKDFDDALSFKEMGDGTYQIGVHIADVSHYVVPGTALDEEAQERGLSAYLVDRTIPMLPEVLSNDLCSLKPDVPRLTFSVWWTLDTNGKIIAQDMGKTIIHSDKRLSYEEAQQAIEDASLPYHKELSIMNGMAHAMRKARSENGSIDFEQDEVRFELSETGVPLSVYVKERFDAHKLIEEFMLLANASVANYARERYLNKRHAFIYRVHDHPDREKLKNLQIFVKATGHSLNLSPNGDVSGKELNRLFREIEGSPEESLIKTSALRSMAKAVYTPQNIGHFGLALPAYTHFTSPIRRYADLLVHRLLHILLTTGMLPNDEYARYTSMADSISMREIDIVGAERDSIKYKQVEYMSTRVGEVFEGVISGVSEWGIFVEEKNTHAEGLIRLRDLGDDFYELEAKNYRIVGKRTGRTFSLGDELKFKLNAVDLDKRTIDFGIVA